MTEDHETDLAGLYHLNSSNVRSRTADLSVDVDCHPFRFRSYPGATRVVLPGRDFGSLDQPLGELLAERASHREFSSASLSLDAVRRLLYASYGVRGLRTFEGQQLYSRPTPPPAGSIQVSFTWPSKACKAPPTACLPLRRARARAGTPLTAFRK